MRVFQAVASRLEGKKLFLETEERRRFAEHQSQELEAQERQKSQQVLEEQRLREEQEKIESKKSAADKIESRMNQLRSLWNKDLGDDLEEEKTSLGKRKLDDLDETDAVADS